MENNRAPALELTHKRTGADSAPEEGCQPQQVSYVPEDLIWSILFLKSAVVQSTLFYHPSLALVAGGYFAGSILHDEVGISCVSFLLACNLVGFKQ